LLHSIVFLSVKERSDVTRHQSLLPLHVSTMAHYHLVAFAFLAAAVIGEASGSSIVGLDLHHRSSPTVRRWAEARGHPQLPAHGTPEYYSELSRHDRALLARRGLAGADGFLSFAAGNDTYKLRGLGL
jgi:hypothetical protein